MEEGQRLLERILDGAEDPTDLPLALLQDITDNFSEERKIGQGGFGAVYKGVLGERIVAVKRIHINEHTFDDKLFHREATSLLKINHRNVVRFLGVCSHGYQKPIDQDGSGKYIWANVFERLLCFDYISNGSLDKHITDELRGLEWEARYEIITGICKGLRYLHTEREIIHMDLKPENILIDHQDGKYMVPKITDFGLSRPNENSHTVGKSYGTRGYWAPEYRDDSKTTPACDIYSLGLIIIELVTGCKDIPDRNNVLRRWRHRWSKPPTQVRYQQVTRCMEIAECCRAENPEARPSISKIISFLNESESTHCKIIPCLDEDDMLRINPLELLLPSELQNEISLSVELTNDTLNCNAFSIQPPSLKYITQQVKGTVQPKSKCYVKITVQPQIVHEHDHADKFIVQSTKWSEGLGEEDITKFMSRAEACKVVDEVDFMVVYESLKNSKNREDANMQAEEVSEVKKRKIVESPFRKDKNKIGSIKNAEAAPTDTTLSLGRQCTAQTEQSNLHTLQSFSSHYPTNKKYLGDNSRAVDCTRGAMGSLLDKLGKLVTEDYSLDTCIRSDIDSFSVQLKKIHLELPKLKNVDGGEVLVDEVRELSYNMEDMVDSFLVRVEPDSSRNGFRELRNEGLKIWENGMMIHHQIGDMLREIKNQVQAVVHKKEEYNFNVNDVVANATDKASIEDLRTSAINIGIEKLIGIEAPRDKLISLFEDNCNISKENLKIVSIVGLGGLGKTTLANAVYEKLQKAQNYTSVFVPVGRNPVVKNVLKKIISEFDKDFNAANLAVWQLRKKLQELLKNKRYLIFIDDIWDSSDWEGIKSAFPENKCGSRVITTTRNHDVALACCHPEPKYVYRIKPLSKEDSKELFFRETFGPRGDCPDTLKGISDDILRKCGGMPLAINSIARRLSGKLESTWEYVWKCLDAMTEGDGLEITKQILDLSYIHLPDHLQTCLLYVCKYPEDQEIDKNDLLRQWVAEGFVHVNTNSKLDAEDEAESYFQKLISMCMIQPGEIGYNNEVLSCRVHDIMLDLLRSKSTELNFIHVIDGSKYVSGASGEIRRVSVQSNDKDDSTIVASIKGSLEHVRSVLLYRHSLLPDFLKYNYVRVLHIQYKHEGYPKEILDLRGISMLVLLRYLKVACPWYSKYELKLPDQIGQLQKLQTVEIYGANLEYYPPDTVSLPWLSHLICDKSGKPLPDGIERLKSLRTLVGVCVYRSSVDSINGLGMLTNLRRLQICSRKSGLSEEVTSMRMAALHSSICKLSSSLRILDLGGDYSFQMDIRCWSKSIFPQVSSIQELDLHYCNFQRCPEWVGQLHGLYKFCITVSEVADSVSIVARLPSLAYFRLESCVDAKEESAVISSCSGAFQALRELIFHCPRTSLTFEAGAMPKLEKLDISFRYHMARRYLPVGIGLLQADNLKEIGLCMDFADDWDDKIYNSFTSKSARDDYYTSHQDEFYQKVVEHMRRFRAIVKPAFKLHYPAADISLYASGGDGLDSENEDYESFDDDEDCCNERDYKVVVEDEDSGRVSINTDGRDTSLHLVEDEDSGRVRINTDGPDTSLHLGVGWEGQKSCRGSQDLAALESLHLPSTSLLAPSPSYLQLTLAVCSSPDRAEPVEKFPIDINNDLFVQRANNGMLVNAVGQYLDLNGALPFQLHDLNPEGGLVDLNQDPPAERLDLHQAPLDEARSTNSSS